MKINVIKDAKGKVIATFEKGQTQASTVLPVLEKGHSVHEMDVADDYKSDLHTFYSRHGSSVGAG